MSWNRLRSSQGPRQSSDARRRPSRSKRWCVRAQKSRVDAFAWEALGRCPISVFDSKDQAIAAAVAALEAWRGIRVREKRYAMMTMIIEAVRAQRPMAGAVTITDHGITVKMLTEGELHIERA